MMEEVKKKGLFKKIALAGGVIAGYFAIHRNKTEKEEESDGSGMDNNAISVHLKLIARHFGGSMNPLHYIITNHDATGADVVFDNLYQAADAHGDETVGRWKEVFFEGKENWTSSDYERKASDMINLLLDCGVVKSEEEAALWNEEKQEKYRMLSKIEDGQGYIILEPYWMFENKIIEKGLVKADN